MITYVELDKNKATEKGKPCPSPCRTMQAFRDYLSMSSQKIEDETDAKYAMPDTVAIRVFSKNKASYKIIRLRAEK